MSSGAPTTSVIDLNRGAVIKKHERSGRRIIMFGDDPGRYFSMGGNEVPIDVAQEAGFDVADDKNEAVMRNKLAEVEGKLKAAREAGPDEFIKMVDAMENGTGDVPEPEATLPEVVLLDDSPLIVARTEDGVPMETDFYVTKHRTRKLWDVRSKENGEAVAEKLSRAEAIDKMIRLSNEAFGS